MQKMWRNSNFYRKRSGFREKLISVAERGGHLLRQRVRLLLRLREREQCDVTHDGLVERTQPAPQLQQVRRRERRMHEHILLVVRQHVQNARLQVVA